MLGKIEGRRRRGRQKMRWLDSIIDAMDMSLCKPWQMVIAAMKLRRLLLGRKVMTNLDSIFKSRDVVWKGFPAFPAHLRMRPVSRRNSRRSLVGCATCRKTPISWSAIDKIPMPGHLFEGNPVDEGTKRREIGRAHV